MATTETPTELIDVDALLAEACAATGLSDWGDTTLRERVAIAVDHLNTADLATKDRRVGRDLALGLLVNRLMFFGDRTKYRIADEVIERPMFATGEPRSGTTLMHALMSVDPNARALRFWELMSPSPPPGLCIDVESREQAADEEWRALNSQLAKWLRSHPYNDMLGGGLPEDERAWNFDFRAMTPTTWWRVPMRNLSMQQPGRSLPADPAAQYRLHKMMLQHLQYSRPEKFWVLKGFHGARLRELFETYPDATLVWLHRDPVQVAASSTMMVADIMEGIVGPVDLVTEAQMHVERVRTSTRNTMENPLVDDPRIFHVRYLDFVADPIGTIRSYYAFAGRTLTVEGEDAMRAYLADNKPDRHGKFHYSTSVLTDAGFRLEDLHEEFQAFRDRFGVEIERRG